MSDSIHFRMWGPNSPGRTILLFNFCTTNFIIYVTELFIFTKYYIQPPPLLLVGRGRFGGWGGVGWEGARKSYIWFGPSQNWEYLSKASKTVLFYKINYFIISFNHLSWESNILYPMRVLFYCIGFHAT